MVNLKTVIKIGLDRLGIRPMHFGVNPFDDFRRRLPNQQFNVLFDVGANEGQTVKEFKVHFPSAEIHCFEPNAQCCEDLRRLSVNVHRLALGNETGQIGFDRSNGQSDMYFVTRDSSVETVPIDTLDSFCDREKITRINFLKIDTEGFDLEVILGAKDMLAAFRIDLMQAEVSMNIDNTYHVPFTAVHREMENRGYRLFGIYEQGVEWGRNLPILRRSNVVYISPVACEANPLWRR